MLRKCDQCDSVTINGVYCHELGCPRNRKPTRRDTSKPLLQGEPETSQGVPLTQVPEEAFKSPFTHTYPKETCSACEFRDE